MAVVIRDIAMSARERDIINKKLEQIARMFDAEERKAANEDNPNGAKTMALVAELIRAHKEKK